MITIDTPTIIRANFVNFDAKEQAEATCRCLEGQYEQENMQEWEELGEIQGSPAKVYYMFENAEAEVEDGADIPFDLEHISRIEIAEKDDEGDYCFE